jgi:hypothetical protein
VKADIFIWIRLSLYVFPTGISLHLLPTALLVFDTEVGLMVKNTCFLLGGHRFKSRGG